MGAKELVICPVFNESDTIGPFYQRLRSFYLGDMLFVDDGSTDATRDFFARLNDCQAFRRRHQQRAGYGQSLLTGFDFARGGGYRKIVTIDADLQHLPRHLPEFFRELDRYPVVLGSRYIKLHDCFDIPRSRWLINHYISGLLFLLFLTRFSDPFCGLRGYRNSFLEKIRLSETSYGLSLEIILEVIRTKTLFLEIPVEAIYLDYSRQFLNGLNEPRQRLFHYLGVISRKWRSMSDAEKHFDYQPPSR